MSPILFRVHAAIADLEHVRIVPVSRACEPRQASLAEANLRHTRVLIRYISRSPPEVAADVSSPTPDSVVAVLAQAIDDWTAGASQRIPHLDVGIYHDLVSCFRRGRRLHLLAKAAQIVLQVVDSPRSIRLRVLFLVSEAPFELRAGLRAGRGINSKLETFAMDVVRQRLHIRKFAVSLDDSLCITLSLPGVVDVDVDVSGITH